MQLQGVPLHLNNNAQQIIAFYNTNYIFMSFIQKFICTTFAIGFEDSIYTLKGQPSNTWFGLLHTGTDKALANTLCSVKAKVKS